MPGTGGRPPHFRRARVPVQLQREGGRELAVRQPPDAAFHCRGLELSRTGVGPARLVGKASQGRCAGFDVLLHEDVGRPVRARKRVCHAVEICRQAGVPYSTLRTGNAKQRDFNIIKLALNIERDKLFDRINRRVDHMVDAGLEQEAHSVYHLRHLNSLNTVGMKEMFAMFDGTMDRHTAIERIKKNTRVYAKKQLTWYRRDPDIVWTAPDKTDETLAKIIGL